MQHEHGQRRRAEDALDEPIVRWLALRAFDALDVTHVRNEFERRARAIGRTRHGGNLLHQQLLLAGGVRRVADHVEPESAERRSVGAGGAKVLSFAVARACAGSALGLDQLETTLRRLTFRAHPKPARELTRTIMYKTFTITIQNRRLHAGDSSHADSVHGDDDDGDGDGLRRDDGDPGGDDAPRGSEGVTMTLVGVSISRVRSCRGRRGDRVVRVGLLEIIFMPLLLLVMWLVLLS
eukprot:CAMPEP_0198126998 /NCGR_PEP_ID=MMETSP1442-20131203/46250_1 /TAXON_ID= /ORGANISM="Craspedostauros australis, Strain CCMP3328" /LENGTH=236 /DNA_ID=CAMNT_0043786901 /DNA_START=158 /DNA_END=865 /DNA_ORIENTATION=+